MEGPKDYESCVFIQDRVKAFYSSGRKRRTKEEVIDTIRYFRTKYWLPPGPGWPKQARKRRIITRFVTYEVSRIIRESQILDPIEILWTYASWIEDMFVESEAVGNTEMTQYIMEAVQEIIDHLE